MVPGILRLATRSLIFNRKSVVYQVIITGLLTAVITGSLLTGYSVRKNLRVAGDERLGNTSVLVSSGSRYFSNDVSMKFKKRFNIYSTGVLEVSGYCQNLSTQKRSLKSGIWFIGSDFFRFHGDTTIKILPGEVAINEKLAAETGLRVGDEIIIRFRTISDIPQDSPFAPEKNEESSVVLRVGTILSTSQHGNFSLNISQITPLNVFVNISELKEISGTSGKINRLLIDRNSEISETEVIEKLNQVLSYEDIGLKIRYIPATGGFELLSDRIFIDEMITGETETAVSDASPLITYLANSFTFRNKSTPYSFISALPASLYPVDSVSKGIIVNRWMAEDLGAVVGDTIEMAWYSPDSINSLKEETTLLRITKVVQQEGIWSDSLLMPEFPGIAGSESCSDWDAGASVKLGDIRDKDEEYWNEFRGTPKAFIDYETGKRLWGSNFGPATSIRFPASVSKKDIVSQLEGAFTVDKSGFYIRDIRSETEKAASESVDFGMLFISLGFFLIVAALVLLSFIYSSYFESKHRQLSTLFALGFSNSLMRRILMTESVLVTLAGSVAGLIGGLAVSYIITDALNSVWSGAVQTDTLISFYGFLPLLAGLISSFIIVLLLLAIKINKYIKKLNRKEKDQISRPSAGKSKILLEISACITVILIVLTLYFKEYASSLSFGAGTILLGTFILFWRNYFVSAAVKKKKLSSNSKRYYSFFPSQGITPILFIAAGIFSVFITEGNRMNFDGKLSERAGGTGGYLIWAEAGIPVTSDINTESGRKAAGFDESQFADMKILQAKRSAGDDASCMNLNHVTAPPLMGVDANIFIERGSFSFAGAIKSPDAANPWEYLDLTSENNVIYGIADQTVLDWGLKVKTGDTLILRQENGQPLKIIIAAGLETSVFQGHLLISSNNFSKYFPSVSGYSVFLIDGNSNMAETYKNAFEQNFEGNGITAELTTHRLASFYQVTNTYLSVFSFFGLLGMVTGIAGLGFVLLRNYNRRKKEFALLLCCGVPISQIRKMIFSEQILILIAGVSAGVVSAIVATLPSLIKNPVVPWFYMGVMIASILITGIVSLSLSVRSITGKSLISSLKSE
jgi:putative ABC transport system permease protein